MSLGPVNYATETNIKWKQVNNEKPCLRVSPLALYDTSNKTSLPSLKNKNKINHKKREQTRGKLLLKSSASYKSETVAIATLYQ